MERRSRVPLLDQTTGEGSTAMMYFNVANGDVPYFTQLARQFTLSDNFHQSVMGGTEATGVDIPEADYPQMTSLNGCVAYLHSRTS